MDLLDGLPKPFFILAPMDDVTDSVFRQIVAECAPPDLFFTEFVNVDGLQSPGRPKLLKKLQFTKKEKPIVAQLWGLKPDNFYKTVKELRDGTLAAEANKFENNTSGTTRSIGGITQNIAGQQADAILSYAGVDLNMGCPVKTVIKNGACAALINNRELAGEIILATKEAAGPDFPVSVKTRVGFSTTDMSWLEFLLQQKLNMLSIHGRTAKQMSKVPANWDLIGQVRELRDSLSPDTKIVGNGDVTNRAQAEQLAAKYNLDGVMIGRGIFHDPFLFAKQSPWPTMAKDQKLELFAKHIKLFTETWAKGEYRFEVLKKFAKIYINDFDGASDLRAKFMQTNSAKDALQLLDITP